jgi:hypothetical protein
LIAYVTPFEEQEKILDRGPRVSFNIWREEVNPALSALLALPLGKAHVSIDLIGNDLPLLLTTCVN